MKIADTIKRHMGLFNTVLLAQHHKVVALDIIAEKVTLIIQHNSPIVDAKKEGFLGSLRRNNLAKVYLKIKKCDLFEIGIYL
jgi:UDPglucose 6-dehydrogenase